MIIVRSPMRISFAGGGTDIPAYYEKNGGGSVCSAAINKYIYIAIKPNTELFSHKYRIVYSQVEECNSVDEIKHPIIRDVLERYRGLYPNNGLDIQITSDIPAGTGMGSSSAFTVGLHRALQSCRLCKYDLAETACETEIENLREPIGKQDQYAAAFGGVNHFKFFKDRVQVDPISISEDTKSYATSNLLLIFVGGSRNAGLVLQDQVSLANKRYLDTMVSLAYEAADALRFRNFKSLGEIVQAGWECKKKLSPKVTTSYADTLIDTAIKNGAAGGKLLGAGGAGFVLLVCPGMRYAVKEALKQYSPQYVNFNFDMEGCKVLYED